MSAIYYVDTTTPASGPFLIRRLSDGIDTVIAHSETVQVANFIVDALNLYDARQAAIAGHT